MKKRFIAIALLLTVCLPMPTIAEFYKYIDEHGNIIYTDDLSKVPVHQRKQVQSYEASQSLVPESTPSDSSDSKKTDEPADSERKNISQQMRALKEQQEALNKEYDNLMAEREKLYSEKEKAVTNEQVKAYNQRIIDFNIKIQAYEEKREAHANKVKAYNEAMSAAENEKPKE